MNLFLDTSYLFALYATTDPHHQSALDLAARIPANTKVFSNNLVLYETLTVLTFKQSRQASIAFGKLTFASIENGQLSNPLINEAREQHSWRIFRSIRAKDVSFVDASILATIEEFEIKTLFTFDRHFIRFAKPYSFEINTLP